MKMNPFSGTLLSALMLLLASCQKEGRIEIEENSITIPAKSKTAESSLLKSVRQATSRFHSTTQAIAAGYEPDDHCVSVPGLGGMGFHWVNPTLVDGVFDPEKPEAILYAPDKHGHLRLVGVEYIVINMGQPRPAFGNQPFDLNGTPVPAPHWSLHVWLYEDNPSGLFAPFNPNVSCSPAN